MYQVIEEVVDKEALRERRRSHSLVLLKVDNK